MCHMVPDCQIFVSLIFSIYSSYNNPKYKVNYLLSQYRPLHIKSNMYKQTTTLVSINFIHINDHSHAFDHVISSRTASFIIKIHISNHHIQPNIDKQSTIFAPLRSHFNSDQLCPLDHVNPSRIAHSINRSCYEFLCLHKTRSCNLAGRENSAHNFLHFRFSHS